MKDLPSIIPFLHSFCHYCFWLMMFNLWRLLLWFNDVHLLLPVNTWQIYSHITCLHQWLQRELMLLLFISIFQYLSFAFILLKNSFQYCSISLENNDDDFSHIIIITESIFNEPTRVFPASSNSFKGLIFCSDTTIVVFFSC